MAILALAREQVKIQVSDKSASLALVVPDAEHLHVFMPNDVLALARARNLSSLLTLDLNEDKTKDLLEDLQHTADSSLKREVLCNQLVIERIVLLQHHAVIEPMVPQEIMSIKRLLLGLDVLLLHLHERLDLLLPTIRQSRAQIAQEAIDRLRVLRHLILEPKRGMVGVSQQPSSFVTEEQRLLEQGYVLIALVLIGNHNRLPRLRLNSVLERGEEIRVFKAKSELALVLTLALLQAREHILGNTRELFPGKPQSAVLLIKVLLELNDNLAQPLLDLLESVPLGARRQSEPVAQVVFVFLLEQLLGLRVEFLVLLDGCVDKLVQVLAHGRLDAEVVHEPLSLGRGVSELAVCRDGLVEAQDMRLEGHGVLVPGQWKHDLVEGGRFSSNVVGDAILDGTRELDEALCVFHDGGGRACEQRRGLGGRSQGRGSH